MSYTLTAITITIVLYTLLFYMSYISATILHIGLAYRLVIPVVKSSAFILLCYIIIISDIVLLHSELYKVISIKNGSLLLLVVASLLNAKTQKGA